MPTDPYAEVTEYDPPPSDDEEPDDPGETKAAEELKSKFGDK
ncbi:hypothetical protein [Nocardia sp. NPDC050710]